MARENTVKKFSWAVPNKEALKKIALFSPIIEIGAGGGYWAKLLRKVGANVTAFDKHGHTTRHNRFVDVLHSRIKRGNWKQLRKRKFANHTLLLCWPPYNDPMAYDCVKAFRGKTIIMVGEDSYGCTGDSRFWGLLNSNFEEFDSVNIPQWQGIHDFVQIYKKRI